MAKAVVVEGRAVVRANEVREGRASAGSASVCRCSGAHLTVPEPSLSKRRNTAVVSDLGVTCGAALASVGAGRGSGGGGGGSER